MIVRWCCDEAEDKKRVTLELSVVCLTLLSVNRGVRSNE